MPLYQLDRSVFSLSPNPQKFLNDYTSNTPESPQTAFLNRQGKIIAAAEQARISEREHWIVVERSVVQALLAHLKPYLHLTDNVMSELNHRVYLDTEGTFAAPGDAVTIHQPHGRLILCEEDLNAAAPDPAYTLFRQKHHMPIQGIDYGDEMLLCVGENQRVSFEKGCYLGQEIIARVHYKGRPPRKLVVKKAAECTEEERGRMTSVAPDPESGGEQGFVFVDLS